MKKIISAINKMFERKQPLDDISALQRSELLDEATCNFCLSMDGRIVSADDEIGKVNVFHEGCRGTWVEIMNDEAELPEITGIPKKLRDIWNKKNNGDIKLKHPILDSNFLAYEYYYGKKK